MNVNLILLHYFEK